MTLAQLTRSPVGQWFSAGVIFTRVAHWLRDRGDTSRAQRIAGAAFGIRLTSAAVVYLSQVVLARWMGGFEFGVYIYVWTWVLLAGELIHLGLPLAAQRFIPQYRAAASQDELRGFVFGARRVAFAFSTAVMLVGAALIWALTPYIARDQVFPLYLACLALPFFTLSIMLDGTARPFNWIGLALAPHFLFRPLAIIALMGAAHLAGFPANATSAMIAVVIGTWGTAIVQMLLIDRRLANVIAPGPRRYEVKAWLGTSLPIFMVGGFYTLLTYTDVIVLQHFRGPQDVGLYYAVARTLLLVTFVYFAVGASVAHRFAACHVAGDRDGLAALVTNSVRWTFWPSLGATALILVLGRPLLALFGPDFVDGYPLMFILAIGPLARASVGPAERLLNMLGEQRACALIYAGALAINFGCCIAFVPAHGAAGAAIAVTAAVVFESLALFVAAKRRLGLHIFIWRGFGPAAAH